MNVIMNDKDFIKLTDFLRKIPAIGCQIGSGIESDSRWWVKLQINIHHKFAWHAVQELGHVLNYMSLDEKLPTAFLPVSPPPYMNGGPEEYLSWVIECYDAAFTPDVCAEWLESRLPNPVDDLDQWSLE